MSTQHVLYREFLSFLPVHWALVILLLVSLEGRQCFIDMCVFIHLLPYLYKNISLVTKTNKTLLLLSLAVLLYNLDGVFSLWDINRISQIKCESSGSLA